ncbi:FixP1 Di-heme cytochrome c (fragment) [Bradyrhizobium sp. ORS 375]|uniref:c-type cytochrome n=1 Tax=Bradyrhizobium sp. (strain ORS 375) TaxID=566679 RepID=UPI0002408AEF
MRSVAVLSVASVLLIAGVIALEPNAVPRAEATPSDTPSPNAGAEIAGGRASTLLQVPVSHLTPGGLSTAPALKNPAAGDPQSAERGMNTFISMNCVGCHAPNGGGGMGPALSNSVFIYGSTPANIYLSIYQGRPNGMPAWGAVLPDSVIWDLVSYIGKISNEPTTEWGRTFSAAPLSPAIEQIPAEKGPRVDPWTATETFSQGQKP